MTILKGTIQWHKWYFCKVGFQWGQVCEKKYERCRVNRQSDDKTSL
jgi:hypothetical protein